MVCRVVYKKHRGIIVEREKNVKVLYSGSLKYYKATV